MTKHEADNDNVSDDDFFITEREAAMRIIALRSKLKRGGSSRLVSARGPWKT